MTRHIPLVLAWLVAIFLVAPMAIIVPMSFSTAISFEFPPPGYWTGYYAQYFSRHAWLDATANSFIIAFGSMVFTLARGAAGRLRLRALPLLRQGRAQPVDAGADHRAGGGERARLLQLSEPRRISSARTPA